MNTQDPILTEDDIAAVLSGCDTFEEETVRRLAKSVRTDPRVQQQMERLKELARDAGLDPESPDSIALVCSHAKDLEALLAHGDWGHPLEVLDLEVVGTRPEGFEPLVRLAAAQAKRSDDPAALLAVVEAVKRLQVQLEQLSQHSEGLLEVLLALPTVVAALVFQQLTARYDRAQRQKLDRLDVGSFKYRTETSPTPGCGMSAAASGAGVNSRASNSSLAE